MATTWDLYDSFNVPEASLAAKRSAYLSKASLLIRDRDPKIQGKYHGQKPDRIHSLLCRRPPRPSHTFSTEHKKCLTQGLSSYVHSALHSEWEIKSSVCFFLGRRSGVCCFETGPGTNWPRIHRGPCTQTECCD